MSKRRLIVVGLAASLLIVGAAALLFSQDSSAPEPLATLSPSPSASPSPTSQPVAFEQDPHDDAELNQQSESAANPVLTKLPYGNSFFELDFGGSRGNKYVLRATIFYVKDKENPSVKIEQQKPRVIEYLRGIGQPDGTYEIDYQPKATSNSYNLS